MGNSMSTLWALHGVLEQSMSTPWALHKHSTNFMSTPWEGARERGHRYSILPVMLLIICKRWTTQLIAGPMYAVLPHLSRLAVASDGITLSHLVPNARGRHRILGMMALMTHKLQINSMMVGLIPTIPQPLAKTRGRTPPHQHLLTVCSNLRKPTGHFLCHFPTIKAMQNYSFSFMQLRWVEYVHLHFHPLIDV